MKRMQFRKMIMEIIIKAYANLTFDEIAKELDEALVQVSTEKGWPTPNSYREWSDEELSIVLADAPTKRNAVRYARAFGRGFGSVMQIYQWAATKTKEIKRKRGDDKFVNQIKRVSKLVGWYV